MGFAQADTSQAQHRTAGMAYTVGVVLSFMLLGGLMLGLRAAGEQLGWGFQLQSPPVVAGLALLFTLLGLNLAGVFEFGQMLPSSLATLQSRHPTVNAGLSGVLAVAVASPCTAPFMGASLGLAVALPVWQALLVFAAMGVGMALPYLAASWWPGMARALPRPGAWMATFRQAMAFPMFATVIWLLWVLGQQTGIDGASSLLALLPTVAAAHGICFSPDGRIMYFSDASARRIQQCDYDAGAARVANVRLFAELAEGQPRGATVDSGGCLWSAQSGRLVRYAPDGAALRSEPLPSAHLTRPAFGGPGLDQLLVGSAGGMHVMDGGGARGLPDAFSAHRHAGRRRLYGTHRLGGVCRKGGGQAADPVKIGFLVKQAEEPWFQDEWRFAEQAAKEKGFTLVKIGVPNGEKMMAAIDNLAAQKAQGFIICAPDVKLGAAVERQAKRQNLKVMSVDDRLVDGAGKPIASIPHMGISGYEIGRQVGQGLAEEMKARGWKPAEVGALRIAYDQLPTAKERTQGAVDALKEAGFPVANI
eukprot:gene25082-31494_t